MPKLFSYVVDHDLGFAPNPFGDFCSLAKCKFGQTNRNIVELAEEGDWIAGTGGADLSKSAGHGKLIYAMRVDEKTPLATYCRANQGRRVDAHHDIDESGRFALLSYYYFYFGRNALDISEIPRAALEHPFEKSGPGHRSDFSDEFFEEFSGWFGLNFKVGVHGLPCKPYSTLKMLSRKLQVRRKRCAR